MLYLFLTSLCLFNNDLYTVDDNSENTTPEQIKEKYQNPDCEVILTGGNAKLILEVLREKPSFEYVYDERHVIDGLVKIHEKVELEVNI